MEKIAIIGAGGFGREVRQLIDDINLVSPRWELVGFFDEKVKKGDVVNGLPVLGNNEEALNDAKIENFVIAIADPPTLNELGGSFVERGKNLPNLFHPSIRVNFFDTRLGCGNIFTYGFFMTVNIEIGNFNIFNTRVTLGHDVAIGSCNVFMPNVQISGNVQIGDLNLFGMNSSVLQKRRIGSKNNIGAHSFVINHIDAGRSVFGVPAVHI